MARSLAYSNRSHRQARHMVAPLANRMMQTRWVRRLMESIVGVHHYRYVLPFASETLPRWWSQRTHVPKNGRSNGKLVLFAGCMVNYQITDVGKAAVQVLEKNGIEVAFPSQQCCGMPSSDARDTDTMVKAAKANLGFLKPWRDQGDPGAELQPHVQARIPLLGSRGREHPALQADF